ncbi:hypothetical protein AMR41_30895 [Hapalosiphon sp. MRB220]|nr:hypothetical protein AMR41_30895 [Hapalosiphon sp. MRB220]
MPNHRNQTPNWQPISQLPLIARMIDDGLVDTVKQYETLQQASSRPHVLDDYTVGRVIKLYSQQLEFLDIYAEQLARWKALDLNATQKKEITRREEQLEKLVGANTAILALASKLKEGTIEKVLEKPDLEMGLDVLLGQMKF